MPSIDGKHEPLVTKVTVAFDVDGHEEQVYVTTPCICGGNCFWSSGAVMYRYDTIDGREDKDGASNRPVV